VNNCNNIISRRVLKHSKPAAKSSIRPCNIAIFVLERSSYRHTSSTDILMSFIHKYQESISQVSPLTQMDTMSLPRWVGEQKANTNHNWRHNTNSNTNCICRLNKQQYKLYQEATQTATQTAYI
jgi:hypothetical protein